MYSDYPNDLPLSLKKKYQLTKLLGKGAVGEVTLAFEKVRRPNLMLSELKISLFFRFRVKCLQSKKL